MQILNFMFTIYGDENEHNGTKGQPGRYLAMLPDFSRIVNYSTVSTD
jgi:hypothetical protein